MTAWPFVSGTHVERALALTIQHVSWLLQMAGGTSPAGSQSITASQKSAPFQCPWHLENAYISLKSWGTQ